MNLKDEKSLWKLKHSNQKLTLFVDLDYSCLHYSHKSMQFAANATTNFLYVDDTLLFSHDISLLQNVLLTLSKWCTEWNETFLSKIYLLQFHRPHVLTYQKKIAAFGKRSKRSRFIILPILKWLEHIEARIQKTRNRRIMPRRCLAAKTTRILFRKFWEIHLTVSYMWFSWNKREHR